MANRPHRLNELEAYAAGTHLVMGAGYIFTIPYHLKRKNKLTIGLHLILAWYHFKSGLKHLEDC